jgi:hypothetical protein
VTTGASDDDDPRRPRSPRKAEDLRRAVRVGEIVGVGLFGVLGSLAYRQRRLRMRAHGAFARWEHDLAHGKPLRAGGRPRRR